MSGNTKLPALPNTDKQIRSYLYQLSEQLNYIFNNLDLNNFTEKIKNELTVVSSAGQGYIKLTEGQKTDIGNLRKQIISQATEIRNEYQKELGETESSIYQSVAAQYLAKAENAELEVWSRYLTEHVATGVIETFEQNTQISTDMVEYTKELDAYIKRGLLGYEADGTEIFGIEIGQEGSNYKSRFTKDKLSFYQGDTEVAYVSGDRMYITNITVLDSISFGESFDPVESSGQMLVVIKASNGTALSRDNLSTTLIASVYKSGVDITEQLPARCFEWVKKSADSMADQIWNNNHKGVGNRVTVSTDDVYQFGTVDCNIIE